MKIGTKSLLFGVHQFVIHPLCVVRAFRLIHQRWPRDLEWLAILVHDWGYWGCSDMNGPEGVLHPALGGAIVEFFARRRHRRTLRSANCPEDEQSVGIIGDAWFRYTAGHSSAYCEQEGFYTSELYAADKLAALMEPRWFYILRAWLSGEGKEYVASSPMAGQGLRKWFRWYCEQVQLRVFQDEIE